MKRFLICALAVGFLAGPVMAAPTVTLWLQARDGTDKVTLGVSETAVIQLWVSVTGGSNQNLVNISAALRSYTTPGFSKDLSYEISGFNDITIPLSGLQRGPNRGPNIAGLLPNAHPDEYLGFFFDPDSTTGTAGLQGDERTELLDEIIIHGTRQNDFTDTGGVKESDILIFALGDFVPAGFFMDFIPIPPPGSWATAPLAVIGTGTGTFGAGNEMKINVGIPEPATLSLIALGGLAAIRRRR